MATSRHPSESFAPTTQTKPQLQRAICDHVNWVGRRPPPPPSRITVNEERQRSRPVSVPPPPPPPPSWDVPTLPLEVWARACCLLEDGERSGPGTYVGSGGNTAICSHFHRRVSENSSYTGSSSTRLTRGTRVPLTALSDYPPFVKSSLGWI